MNKDKNLNKKTLKKFLNLLDKGLDTEACLARFPDQRETLRQYAAIIGNFKNLKNIQFDKDFENNSLKDIYLQTRIENLKNRKKISKKDAILIRLRPAYLKPLVIFLGIFIFMSFSFAGTLYASESSVPGDTLYTLKRTSENIHIAFTPYKYEEKLYLKLLDKRLSEADVILNQTLNQTDFIDTIITEKLIADIDSNYERCHKRNYLDTNLDKQIQIRIRAVKEGFAKRHGMQKNNISDFPVQTSENVQESTVGSDIGKQGPKQNNSGNNNNKTGQDSCSDTVEQNQTGKQNQYGK